MDKEELKKEARERAKKIEENQTIGVYDRDEDLEYDKGWNAGEVSGYEEGYIEGAEYGYEYGYKEGIKTLDEVTRAFNREHQKYTELRIANERHDLRKDPNDLPKGEGTYFVVWQNDNGYRETFMLKYEEDDEEELHWVDDDYEVQDEYIIAWCELPKFEV